MEEFNLIKKSKNKDSESQKKREAYVEKCISFLILPISKLSMFLKLMSISGFWQISEKDEHG